MTDTNHPNTGTILAALVALVLVVSAASAGATTVAPAATAQTQQQTVSIAEIQQPNGSGGASPYEGTNVTTSGTVTAVTGEGFYLQDGTGPYSGVYVYTGSAPAFAPGDAVEVTAPVQEYYGLTELDLTASNASATQTGTAAVPAATQLNTSDVGQEAYEGVLVAVSDVTVSSTPDQYGEWDVDDGSGSVAVDDVTAGDAATPNETGATIDSLEGPVAYTFSEFKIQPTAVGTIAPPSDGGDGGDGGSGNATTLTIVSYNDVQTAASNPEAMGKLVSAIAERRAAHDNPTVVVGGGDQVSPSSLSPVSNWTVPIDVLNVVDPAAEVVGNHDLDYGFDAVSEFSAASEFPWLLANVRHEDGSNLPGTQNYTIVERGDVSVGIIGLVDEAIQPKTAVDFEANGYEVADFSAVGGEIATRLKEEEGVDVVVAAAHIGIPESQELAAETENIDVIVTGDDEVEYAPQVTSGTVIMEAEARAEHLAELNLTVAEDGSVSMASGRLLTVAGSDDVPVNATASDVVESARGEYLSVVAGETEVALDSTFSSNYHDETAWGNLITDAFRWQTGAEVAVTNAGGIRGNFVIEPGNVTYDDVYTSLPFGNTLVTKELSGAELVALLESQVVTLESPTGQQYGQEASLQVSGVTYEMVAHEGADPIVRDVFVGGEPLVANATYNVTVNSYMATWDDLADDPTVGQDYTLYGTAVAEYIEAQGTIAPADTNRIRRVDREVGSEWIFLQGWGVLPVHFHVPDTVQAVNDSTFRIENATTGTLAAEEVRLEGDDLLLYFDAREFRELASQSVDLQVYGEYTDAEYDDQLVYFENAVLNGDLENWELPPWYDGGDDEEDDHDGDDGWGDGDWGDWDDWEDWSDWDDWGDDDDEDDDDEDDEDDDDGWDGGWGDDDDDDDGWGGWGDD